MESLVLRFKASRIPSLAGGGPRNTMELPPVLPGWLRMQQDTHGLWESQIGSGLSDRCKILSLVCRGGVA